MLTQLKLKNFKAWRKVDFSLGKVTGLFGTNSSGKSSLIQFLLMLKQTKNSPDRSIVLEFGGPGEELVNLGSFSDIAHGHESDSEISWQLTWELKDPLTIYDATKSRRQKLASGTQISTRTKVFQEGKSIITDELVYEFSGFSFELVRKKEGGNEFSLIANSPEGKDFKFIRNQQRVWALPGPLKTYLFPDQAKTYYQNAGLLSSLEAAYETFIDSIYYLGPLREPPRREYTWSGSSPHDVGQRGERAIPAMLAASERRETRNLQHRGRYQPFEVIIAYWLKELGLIHSFRVEEIGSGSNLYKAVVKRDASSPEVLLTDVGFGVSQVLPALVLMYYVPEGSTIIMEQPEIHLHPSVQSGLADVIIRVATHRKIQVLVESHSEHLLRRFQRRVAEDKKLNSAIRLFFCSGINGMSELNKLDINIFGEITNWPDNFFGDEMTEIAETQKAILRNQINAAES